MLRGKIPGGCYDIKQRLVHNNLLYSYSRKGGVNNLRRGRLRKRGTQEGASRQTTPESTGKGELPVQPLGSGRRGHAQAEISLHRNSQGFQHQACTVSAEANLKWRAPAVQAGQSEASVGAEKRRYLVDECGRLWAAPPGGGVRTRLNQRSHLQHGPLVQREGAPVQDEVVGSCGASGWSRRRG